MFYGSKEEQDKAIMKQVNKYRNAAAIFPYLRKVIESFDGKVYNIRLEKALREDGNFWTVKLNRNDRYGDMLTIDFQARNDHAPYGYSINVVYVNLGKSTDPKSKWDGKRIPASVIVESAREKREINLKNAAELESVIDREQSIREQIQYFAKQIDKLVDPILYYARDVYDLNYRVRRN